jgi:predicted kinase
MMSDAQLLLVRGIVGSGKTFYAQTLTDRVHYETDMYFEQDGEYRFDGSKLPVAHRWCQAKVYQALKEGKKVVVSNTFTRLWEMKDYFNMAKELNVTVDVEEMKGRYPNLHGVPDDIVQKMLDRWEVYTPEDENGKIL